MQAADIIADGVFYIGVYSAFGDAGHYFKGFRHAVDWSHFTDRLDAGWRDPHWTDATDPDGNFFDEQGQTRYAEMRRLRTGRCSRTCGLTTVKGRRS